MEILREPPAAELAAFDRLKAPARFPGEAGLLLFLAADMMVFGLFFVTFMAERRKNVGLFELSRQALDINLGGINTLILLTSSWFVVQAVQAAKANRVRQVAWLLALAAMCGGAFITLKIVEYSDKLSHGISMLTNDYYMFYFIFTSIHMMHVVGGTVMLIVLANKARAGAYHSANTKGLESGALFWHMVDLLWIVLFPLLYLMR
jgi:nitric oxide reductase NorE protein